MSENTSEALPPNPLKAKKLKIIKIVVLLFIVVLGIAFFTPAKKLFAKTEDPRLQDTTFRYAVGLATQLVESPMCMQIAKMIINFGSPSAGSEEYRYRVVESLTNRIPEACILPAGSPPARTILDYIAGTRPVVQE